MVSVLSAVIHNPSVKCYTCIPTMPYFRFLISSFYSKAKLAAACAGIFYFLTYVPYMYIAIREDVKGSVISSTIKTFAVS